MIVDDFRRSTERGIYEISARLRPDPTDAKDFRLWFRFPEQYAPGGDLDASPFVPHVLTWCLRHREPLTIDGPVSARLLGEMDEIIRVYRAFFPQQIREAIPVYANAHVPAPGRELTASLFTRGIDSWFAALTAQEDRALRPPITHLVHLPSGPSHWTDEQRDTRIEAIRKAANRAGLELIRLDSNIKQHFGRGQFAMGLVLGFTNVLLPSDDMRAGLRGKGLHPFLDPRFSTERTELHHYGDASRLQKTERVAESEDALETLAVCKDDDLELDRNCGRCEKCLRTMLSLHAIGALDRCPVFDEPLNPSNLEKVNDVRHSRQDWLDALLALGDSGFDRQLAAGARMVIFRSDVGEVADRAEALAKRDELRRELRYPRLLTDSAKRLRAIARDLERGSHTSSNARRRMDHQERRGASCRRGPKTLREFVLSLFS